MKVRVPPVMYICAGCGYVLEILRLPGHEAGEHDVTCSNPWCEQFGDTVRLKACVLDLASTNTVRTRTWPADAP